MKKAVMIAGLTFLLFNSGYVWAQDDEGQHKEHSDAEVSPAQGHEKEGGALDKAQASDPATNPTTGAEAAPAPAHGHDNSAKKAGGCCE